MKTLEEAAENYEKIHGGSYSIGVGKAFKFGANYLAERMYSEEDMKQFAWKCVANFLSNKNNEIEQELVEVIMGRNNLEFEQFKKK